MSSNQVTAKQAVAANLKVDPSGVTSPVSIASLPLPTGAATETTLAAQSAKLPAALGQAAMAASLAVVVASNQTAVPVSGTVAVSTALALDATLGTTNTDIGGLTETAPATDTASSGLNGRLQRIAQRLTSIIALLPTALGANGGLKVEGIAGGVAQPVSGTVTTTPPSNASTNVAQVNGTTTDSNSGSKSAGTLRVVLATDQPALTNTLLVTEIGSTAIATGQVVPTTSAATLLAARTGRKRVIFLNQGSATVFVGPVTVTTANGFPIDPGASLTLYTGALVQAIISTGTLTGYVAYSEEF